MKLSKIIRHPLSITTVAAGVLVLIILIGTPYLIGEIMQRWIESQGPLKEKVKDIDFNPFTGTLVLHDLQVETDRGRSLEIPFASLKLSWPHLVRKQVYLKNWTIQDAYLQVDTLEGNRLRVAGIILEELIGATDQASTPEWSVGVGRFQILNSRVIYNTPAFDATYHIDSYELSGLESWNKDKSVEFELNGKIDASPVLIKAEGTPFASSPRWKGTLKLQKGELSLLSKVWGLRDISIDGSISGDLDFKTVQQENEIIDITTKGSVNITPLKVRNPEIDLSEEHLTWEGTVAAKKTSLQGLALLAEGKLSSGNFDAQITSEDTRLQLAGYTWQGKTQFEQKDDSSSLTMDADLEGGDTSVTDTLRNLKLLQFKKIDMQNIAVRGFDDIHVSGITLQQPLLLAEEQNKTAERKYSDQPLVQITTAEIKSISLKRSKDLSINTVHLKDVRAYLRREKQGGWYLLDTPGKAAEHDRKEPGQPKQPSDSPPVMKIDLLQISGSSSFRFEDESTYRPYHTALDIREFQLSNIHTEDTATPARLKLHGQVGEYGSMTLDGDIRPFGEPLSFDMKGQVKALNMPPLSSYTGPAIGYNMTSGQMDADLDISAASGELKGNADLHMRNLEVAKVDPEKVPELDKHLKVPLGQALSFLEDDNDEIRLNIEIEGNINNPEFNYQDVINQALGKAMKLAAVEYLKYTLQPFGTYIAVAELAVKAGEEITKVRLEPLQFTPGSSELNETAHQYLERVAEVLKNRPKLRIELCGKAVEKDRIAMQERLQETQKDAQAEEVKTLSEEDMLNLARDRAELVKSALSNKHGIRHERMYLCLPEIEASPEIQPMVELLLE